MAGTRKKPLNGVVAVAEGALADEHVLGSLAMSTNPDEPKPYSVFVRSWAKHGLDTDDLPEKRSLVHVFQSACASVKQRRSGAGERVEVTADEVQNNGTCDYQITLKVWDRANRVIEHQKGMRVEFNKTDATIRTVALDGWDDSLRKVETRIRKHFDANGGTIPGQKVRNALRAQLHKVGGQNLRRKAGGVYFVPKEWNDGGVVKSTRPVLDGLAGVLEDLYGDRADFYAIPLANDEGERAMVRKHFMMNVNAQAQELAEKAAARVRQGKGQRGVRADLLDNLHAEQRSLLAAVQQFDSLVSVERSEVAENLAGLQKALSDLQDLADE